MPEMNPRNMMRTRGVEGSPLLAGAKNSPVALIAAEQARYDEAQAAAALESPLNRLPEQERVRREKLEQMVAAGMDPYIAEFHPDTDIADIRRAIRISRRTPGPASGEDRRSGDAEPGFGQDRLRRGARLHRRHPGDALPG